MKIIYEAEKKVEWDDIPKTIQKKIVKLERELQDWRDFYANNPDFKKYTKSLQKQIDQLEKPYYK